MKKVKLAEIKNKGWEISEDDRDKIAQRKISLNLDGAVTSIAESVGRIAESSKRIKPVDNADMIKTWESQTKSLSKLVNQLIVLVKQMKVSSPEPSEQVVHEGWKFHIERDYNGQMDDIIATPIKK